MNTRGNDLGDTGGAPTADQARKFGRPGVTAIAALLFVVPNTKSVPFNLPWSEFTAPPWLMLVIFAASERSCSTGSSAGATTREVRLNPATRSRTEPRPDRRPRRGSAQISPKSPRRIRFAS
jgi:hypothetical protein